MGLATNLVKFLIFLFNFLFVIGGIALIVFGVLFYNGYNEYKEIVPNLGPYAYPPILMMITGGIIFVIAFLGCCGVLRASKCMMMTYATVLLILLIAEVAIVVLFLTKQDDVVKILQDEMTSSMEKYSTNPEIKEAFDSLQHNLECCGVKGPGDWFPRLLVNPPDSCCVNPSECQGSNTVSTALNTLAQGVQGKFYTTGCLESLFDTLMTTPAMYAAGVLAGIELFGVIFGCCLGARFGRKLYHT